MKISQNTISALAETPEVASYKQMYDRVLARASTDETFRTLLKADARAALAEEGQFVPESLDLRFIENEGDATILLPPRVTADAELSAEELEAVAGGSSPYCISFLVSLLIR